MNEIMNIKDPVLRLFAFAKERHAIYERRERGVPPPWTNDEILRDYRFCNVYRENDKVTKWIRDNWREPNQDDPDLWFAMCMARLFNEPSTLQVIGYPVPFDIVRSGNIGKKLASYEKRGNKIFNGAYIILGGLQNETAPPKHDFTMKKIAFVWQNLIDAWKSRERLRPTEADTLNSYHMTLGQIQGFGSFMAAQVIADLKYHAPLSKAADWETFAASGPGSRRGLNYVLERPRKSPWSEDEWRMQLTRLREQLLPLFAKAKMPRPHAQDVQNLLCEFNKYFAARTEGKRPKQLYRWKQ